jgi:hypothetical protein
VEAALTRRHILFYDYVTENVLERCAPYPDQVESFAQADPYVTSGLVTAWRVEPWNVVS